jgi:hypothetical protein
MGWVWAAQTGFGFDSGDILLQQHFVHACYDDKPASYVMGNGTNLGDKVFRP